jgi:hypothetical protein
VEKQSVATDPISFWSCLVVPTITQLADPRQGQESGWCRAEDLNVNCEPCFLVLMGSWHLQLKRLPHALKQPLASCPHTPIHSQFLLLCCSEAFQLPFEWAEMIACCLLGGDCGCGVGWEHAHLATTCPCRWLLGGSQISLFSPLLFSTSENILLERRKPSEVCLPLLATRQLHLSPAGFHAKTLSLSHPDLPRAAAEPPVSSAPYKGSIDWLLEGVGFLKVRAIYPFMPWPTPSKYSEVVFILLI